MSNYSKKKKKIYGISDFLNKVLTLPRRRLDDVNLLRVYGGDGFCKWGSNLRSSHVQHPTGQLRCNFKGTLHIESNK